MPTTTPYGEITLGTKTYTRTIAKAGKPRISREDHGILTVFLDLDYGGSVQGIPLYALDFWDKDEERRAGHKASIEFIMALMDAFGVDDFSKIEGKSIFALHDAPNEGGYGLGYIKGLEPLPTEKGRAFVFEDIFPKRTDDA
jgi:hypothetical protein